MADSKMASGAAADWINKPRWETSHEHTQKRDRERQEREESTSELAVRIKKKFEERQDAKPIVINAA